MGGYFTFFFFSHRMFLQYVDNSVLHLTKGFISRLVEGRQFMLFKQLVRKALWQWSTRNFSFSTKAQNQAHNWQE